MIVMLMFGLRYSKLKRVTNYLLHKEHFKQKLLSIIFLLVLLLQNLKQKGRLIGKLSSLIN